jgi:hypothetical protein
MLTKTDPEGKRLLNQAQHDRGALTFTNNSAMQYGPTEPPA